MKRGRITGGIHPAGKKELTSGKAIPEKTLEPAMVVIPLRQHIGRECEPLVAVGQKVARGEKIGDGEGLCIPVHASVSGRVIAIEDRPHPGGGNGRCVIIENDGLHRAFPGLKAHPEPRNLSREELLKNIRESGIVGMGGAAFPTEVKADVEEGVIQTVIVNACECEPYITADDILLQEYAEEVLGGLAILGDLLKADQLILAVEDNKTAAIRRLQRALSGAENHGETSGGEAAGSDGGETQPLWQRMNVKPQLRILPSQYPQGAEKLLIYAVTGKEVPSGQLSRTVGCAVFNAATCAAVYGAVVGGDPLTHRIVTVTGEAVAEPKNLIVPIGMTVRDVIGAAGDLGDVAVKVICGGPMMGVAQETLSVPVVKGTNAVVCLTERELDRRGETDCIRCGKCVEVCPVNLQPLYLYRSGNNGDAERLTKLCAADCISCGCCSYICPAKLPLLDGIRKGRAVLEKGKEAGK